MRCAENSLKFTKLRRKGLAGRVACMEVSGIIYAVWVRKTEWKGMENAYHCSQLNGRSRDRWNILTSPCKMCDIADGIELAEAA